MSKICVQPVATRRDRKTFLSLPWRLYKNDRNWVPPLRMDQAELVGYRRHPFYKKNEIQTFLARRDGEVVGRIAAIDNQDFIEAQNERRGFFGFFECVDDQEAADALFDAAKAWLAERDLPAVRGPANPGQNHTAGFLVDGFDTPPTFMMTYNPPYYERLIENHGFHKSQDLLAFWGNIDMLPKAVERFGALGEEICRRYNVGFRPLNRKQFRQDVELFLTMYNRSMVNTWGFAPMSEDEVRHVAGGLQYLLIPELALCAEIDGKPVGVVLCLPDYNPTIRRINGRLFPFGFLRLLRAKHRIKKVRLIAANVLPEYQLLGLGMVLLQALLPAAMERGLDEVEYSWIAESNRLSRRSLEKAGAKLIKTYRMYDWDPA